jgi:hypothetical protein
MARVSLLVAVTTTVVCVAAGVWGRVQPPAVEPVEAPAGGAPARHRAIQPPAIQLLRAWDERRAEAWATGDLRRLAGLYTPASVAGRRDRAMLRAWLERGLVVRGMRTQLLEVRERQRTATSWTLQVTDRVVGATAVGDGLRLALPDDAATTRTVVLRRVRGRWRVAAVRPPPGRHAPRR